MDTDASILENKSGSRQFGGFHLLKWINPEDPQVDLQELWNKVATQDYAFDDFSRGRVEWFLANLADLSGRTKYFLIGDHGLFVVMNLMQGGDPSVHFIIWDRNFSLHRNKVYAYELLDYLFYDVKVHRVTGPIPSYNRLASPFVLSVGFKFEGEMQEAVLWKGNYYNVQMYGLLEEWYRKRRERIQ